MAALFIDEIDGCASLDDITALTRWLCSPDDALNDCAYTKLSTAVF